MREMLPRVIYTLVVAVDARLEAHVGYRDTLQCLTTLGVS